MNKIGSKAGKRFIVGLSLMVMATVGCAEESLVLAGGGQTNYKIIISAHAS